MSMTLDEFKEELRLILLLGDSSEEIADYMIDTPEVFENSHGQIGFEGNTFDGDRWIEIFHPMFGHVLVEIGSAVVKRERFVRPDENQLSPDDIAWHCMGDQFICEDI